MAVQDILCYEGRQYRRLGGMQVDIEEWDGTPSRVCILNSTHQDKVLVGYIEPGEYTWEGDHKKGHTQHWVSWPYLRSVARQIAHWPVPFPPGQSVRISDGSEYPVYNPTN
jgi:hypothetical protein